MAVNKRSSNLPARVLSLYLLFCVLLFSSFQPESPVSGQSANGFSGPVTLSGGTADGAAVWGDIDNDGDQDLLITGRGNNEAMTSLLLRNSGGTLSAEGSAGLPPLESSSIALADYDLDGDLDAVVTGQSGVNLSGEVGLARVYRNDGSGAFTQAQNLTGVYRGWADWGDYDLDGDMDILISGYQNGGNGFGAIYRNDSGTFTIDASINVPAVGDSYVLWGDYDADKDLDFVILGKYCKACTTRIAMVMQNNGSGYFWPVSLVPSGLWNGAAAWLDVDTDGDFDLLISGNAGPDSFNRIPTTLLFLYNYTTGLTLAPTTNLPPLWQSTISIGDYDNDGDPDPLLTGIDASGHQTVIYTNNHGTFNKLDTSLANGTGATVAWGQLDGDGNLDIAVTGVENAAGVMSTYLYHNTLAASNTVPTPPEVIAGCWDSENTVTLDWEDASDVQTPTKTLAYSVRVGTSPGMGNIANPPAAADGYRRISITDGTSTRSLALFNSLPAGAYSWAVQAVDSAFGGSPFSGEGSFLVGTRIANDDNPVWAAPSGTTLIPVLDNDNSSFGSLVIHSVEDPPHGWATESGGQLSYTPDPGWSGTETVEYTALSPSTGYCSRGIATISTPGIYLNDTKVNEGLAVGTVVGAFNTTHTDSAETFTYSLVPGTGSVDNASFTIDQDRLLTAEVFDYEVKSSYSILVQATGSSATIYTKAFTITITNETLNPPSDITISYDAIQENLNANSTVGRFSCTDPDPKDWCKYALVSGPGSQDNGSFSINWFDLRTRYAFDYETKSSYSIRIRATDDKGFPLEKVFTIAVINVSDNAPADLLLNKNSIVETQPANTPIGTFTPLDSDPADTFRYRLVAGTGSTDNASFNLVGNTLRSSVVFDYDVQQAYSIRVRVTDQTDRYLEKVFTILIVERPPESRYMPFISNKP